MQTISELINVTGLEREIGFKRLGRVLLESLEIQKLSIHTKAPKVLKNLFGTPINKDHLSKLTKGHVGNPSLNTYRRLTPLLFRVKYFECSESDPIGKPVFEFSGNYADDSDKKLNLLFASSVEQLPDLEYRYHDYRDLIKIVKGEVNTKKTFLSLVRR